MDQNFWGGWNKTVQLVREFTLYCGKTRHERDLALPTVPCPQGRMVPLSCPFPWSKHRLSTRLPLWPGQLETQWATMSTWTHSQLGFNCKLGPFPLLHESFVCLCSACPGGSHLCPFQLKTCVVTGIQEYPGTALEHRAGICTTGAASAALRSRENPALHYLLPLIFALCHSSDFRRIQVLPEVQQCKEEKEQLLKVSCFKTVSASGYFKRSDTPASAKSATWLKRRYFATDKTILSVSERFISLQEYFTNCQVCCPPL